MATPKSIRSRRSFLAAGAAAAAAGVVLGEARAARPASWRDALEQTLPTLRAAYLAEVEELAREVAPRLAAGELQVEYADSDDKAGTARREALEAACAERFGLQVQVRDLEDGGREWTGDYESALLVLALSPQSPEIIDEGWYHMAYAANETVVLDLAAALGLEADPEPPPPAGPSPTPEEVVAAMARLPAQAREAADEAAAAAERFVSVAWRATDPAAVAEAARDLHLAAGRAAGICAALNHVSVELGPGA